LILSSTDIRTPKVSQLVHSSSVEFALWAEKTQEQYRVAGRATLVPPPTHPTYVHFQPQFPSGVDWEQKRREMFNAMGAHMRASWCRPTPGSPLESYDKAKEWPTTLPKVEDAETEEEKKQIEFAFGNFAVLIIDPVDVDYVELGKVSRLHYIQGSQDSYLIHVQVPNQRTRFFKEGEEWKEQILVP
jgi:pyridoxamine 5'-phosphate oxidase